MYKQRFEELLITTAKGFGIGAAISLVLIFVTGMATDIGVFILGFLFFTISFGSVASIIICAKTGAHGYMSSAAMQLWSGIKGLFFGNIFGGNIVLLALGIIKLFIGIIVMIPVGLYMVVSYFLNFIYLGIMSLLEKKNKLEDKLDLCKMIDKLVSAISLVIVIIFCFLIWKSM